MAATDNTFSAETNRQSDLYFQVRPGVLFAYDAPRMIQELTAEVEVLEYVTHSDTPSLTFRSGWKGFFLPGPRSEVTLSANASNGKLHALSARTSPDQTGVTLIPPGPVEVQQGDASEYLSWQSSKQTRTLQTAFARYTGTSDDLSNVTTKSYEVGASLGFERTFQHDTVGIEAGGSYLYLERDDPAMGNRRDRQGNPHGTAVWRHDLSLHWSANVDAGIIYVNPIGKDKLTDVGKGGVFPVVGGLIAYSDLRGRAALSVRRSVAPNLYIAQNTVDDSAIVQLAMPLTFLDPDGLKRAPKWLGLGSLGVERTQLIDPAASDMLQGEFKLARADVGIAWLPAGGQTYGLRYEFAYQTGTNAGMAAPTFHRSTVFFTFALRFPDRVAAAVPRRTQSVRADRGDLAPVGAEPVVPDAAEPTPGGEGGGP